MSERIGVMIVGLNGAVSSTVVAGVEMMLKGVVGRHGMLTERSSGGVPGLLTDLVDFVPLENMVFGGWDISDQSMYDAALEHGVFRADQMESVRETLSVRKPWPALFNNAAVKNLEGRHVLPACSHRDSIAALRANIRGFMDENKLDRAVMVNLASTERWLEPCAAYETLDAFEAALDADDAAISPTMRYFYAANTCGVPHVNFAPSLANVTALREQAEKLGVPYAGMDGKTGQTLVKTALASMFRARKLHVDGWYSTNFLGNSDGRVLDDEESNKTKVSSKVSVLDSLLGYPVQDHQVHIHYYKPRGDAKEAWDNIDVTGFADQAMQMKVNFLCRDSILAAPLVIDLIRLIDLAHVHGEKGVQKQLSLFFKSPYVNRDGETAEHDLFQQEEMLNRWVRKVAVAHSSDARTAKLH